VWSQQIITELREASLERKGRLMTIIRRLGSDPAAVLASAALSFGEARKLWIADALERRSPILLLDEPTNHLDLTGIEAIEQGLADYEGTLVVVSHDERLIGALTKRLWRVEGGEVRELRVDELSGVSRDGALNQ
jgi:ATPase subunit of ABC transporter with duplicated ATPase domains